ncbi:hypothetical protein K504DRAFT_505114 [Pleomassaria siparia CBS 279.74]|uniref:Uncharacterized protein n=1 Tax=Pleomassaria siparia CBS 279.74 TaxID=1314801 RepID=A0A6G1JZX1_9PLEO|nr:hypothetical protein K504DRAFT_505114 [Pleomassaria siparia CBS 279.74]
MDQRRTGRYHRYVLFSTSVLLFTSPFPGSSNAQTFDAPSSTTSLPLGRTPTVEISTMSSSTSRMGPQKPMTTLFTVSTEPNTTTSSTSSTTSGDPPDQYPLFPIAQPPDGEQQRNESVFNYYFLFLAAFVAIIVVGLWLIHRRRKKRKEQMRLSGQHALARDLDGWVNTRRWMHGNWRHNQASAFVRREEGLNEHGEAPPPYQPKSDVTVSQGDVEATQDSARGLTIPLRALSRDEMERSQPPGYRATARPDAVEINSNSPTRGLRVETAQSNSGTPS